MKQRMLYVPSRVSLRSEVWQGLSFKDAIKSVLVGGIAAGLSAALHFTLELDVLWCALIAIIAAAFSVTVLTRFDSGLSIMDFILISLKYSKEQKRFYYVYRRKG